MDHADGGTHVKIRQGESGDQRVPRLAGQIATESSTFAESFSLHTSHFKLHRWRLGVSVLRLTLPSWRQTCLRNIRELRR